jgi:hypothetical protein
MSVDVAQLVGGAFGGAIASSVIGPLIADRGTRRALRGDVLRSLSDVERARWAGGKWEWDDFQAAKHSLRAAALVAGANREVVDRYLRLATVARRSSDRSAELLPEEAGGGVIQGILETLVSDSATLVVDELWHPHRRRFAIRRRLAQNERDEAAAREKPGDDFLGGIDWDVLDL